MFINQISFDNRLIKSIKIKLNVHKWLLKHFLHLVIIYKVSVTCLMEHVIVQKKSEPIFAICILKHCMYFAEHF